MNPIRHKFLRDTASVVAMPASSRPVSSTWVTDGCWPNPSRALRPTYQRPGGRSHPSSREVGGG